MAYLLLSFSARTGFTVTRSRRTSRQPANGFALLEAVVSLALLATTLVSLAEMLAYATRAAQHSRDTSATAILAAWKIEQLRALAWQFDPSGATISDITTNTSDQVNAAACPPVITGAGTGLTSSPGNTLQQSVEGYVDHLDASGCVLGTAATIPRGAVYTRRWAIQALPADPGHSLAVQVRVFRSTPPPRGAARQPTEARLATILTRVQP